MRHAVSPSFVLCICAAPLLVASPARGQSAHTANTLALDDPDRPGAATLAEAGWLVGAWSGEAFGGQIQEAWTPPLAGTMMGTFKHVAEGEVTFYEFLVLEQDGATITLKLKHFTPALVGWEEKDDFVTFPLVRAEEGALYFRGLTFLRTSPDRIDIHLALRQEGVVREEHLVLRALR